MLLTGWLATLVPLALSLVHAQDATVTCKNALGLSSGMEDGSITSPLGEESTPTGGRLNNEGGAWCFNNESIASHNAVLVVDLGYKRFVSGFGSQGPPESIHPKTYNHLVGFSTAFSLDMNSWDDFNGGNLFFDVDKNDTSGVVNYHVSSTVELTRYVKINVTMHVSGSTTICLRFELYGCDTNILPSTNIQAFTTTKGKIEVKWQKPSIETSLESDVTTFGILTPAGYAVLYRPTEAGDFATAATGDRMISLEDVRLGATYIIQLQCIYQDITVSCGSTEIEAYPPCPEGFTGGNEYHCFLYLNPVSSFSQARDLCLNSQFEQQLGTLGYLVDEEERSFLVSRILPTDSSELWLIGEACKDSEDCCKLLKVEGNTLVDDGCSDKALTAALCVRDHKGEGARLRVSSVEAADDGSSSLFTWKYEGIGWKTDELQVKMWKADAADNPSTLRFSTLSNTFPVEAEVGVMYSLLLRPAPNIRTEEFVYSFIIIDFQEDSAKHGALLTPVPMSIYIIWSGSIRVKWDDAKAVSKSGKVRLPDKYSITHQMTEPASTAVEVPVESGTEFVLTPIQMRATYVFKMSCYFVGTFHPCGEISITTDPPNLILYKPSKVYVIYEVIPDKLKMWAEAEDDCKQRAGHLTSLLDDAEASALLKMLPNLDSKVWTGAKLGKKGTGYWTDGEKITDLPMAKNSGVTSSSESCCRAINEMGKLRLAGGNCEDALPYICKYTVDEIMTVPSELIATEPTWNSFRVSWSKPNERWLPTFYNVRACLSIFKMNCVVRNKLKDEWQLNLGNLLEFHSYEVQVEAVLEPVDVKTVSETSTMTYPKSPVRVSISPKGEAYVNTPMLVATGFPSASVTATLSQMDMQVESIIGGVKDLALSGLVPEETYKLVVKHDGGDWTHELTFSADPTCLGMDVLVGENCYSLVQDSANFEDAKKKCSDSTDDKGSPGLWTPLSEDQLKEVTMNVGPFLNTWVQKPSISNIGSDESCSKGSGSCCFYDISSMSVLCSSCCDQKLPFICSYKIKETYIGGVSNLLPDVIGNTTIRVQWDAPSGISWLIRRFEVEWVDEEKSASVGKDIVIGVTNMLMEGLELGTEYDVKVTPLGAASVRGQLERILITTLDPRTPVSVYINSDGIAKVYSPLLIEKGRGSDEVNLRIFKVEGESMKLMTTASGQIQGVEITGLEVGQQYFVEITSKGQNKMFNYSTEFSAFPSCEDNQIQDGLVCVWAPPNSKTWNEAFKICRDENGDLLDYKTQDQLSQPVKALLSSYIETRFWLDMGSEGVSALREADTTNCDSGLESEVMCCSFDNSKTGELDNLDCECCNEPRPFACKKTAKLSLGSIGDVQTEDVTENSVKLTWTLASESKWQKPSFLVTWSEASSRKKRAVEGQNEKVVQEPPAVVEDLKSGTKYSVKVAPYTEATKSSGDAKEATFTTRDDISAAGLVDGGCTIVILKISCCITVILGSGFTVFVFIATRMFYLDCLAQMFAEMGTLGAYMCILVSSAQSYNDDTECLRAHPTLCVAVSVLIQFFFQVIYMFMFMESLLICSVLKSYLPECCAFRSLLAMSVSGFGIPAVMMIVLAAVAGDGFSDGYDNCWLDLQGTAMLPSVIPVIVFGTVSCILLVSVFDADGPRPGIPNVLKLRGRVYMKTRWGCFLMLALTTTCYATGMIGVNNRDATLNYVFVGFSTALGILMPIVRIRSDDEVREQLKRGLFASLKDDIGAIRVSPAPVDRYDPNPLLNMSEFESRQYKRRQLDEMRAKDQTLNADTVWHQ